MVPKSPAYKPGFFIGTQPVTKNKDFIPFLLNKRMA
jgi:hypothetical protein